MPRHRRLPWGQLVGLIVLTDALSISVGLVIAYHLRFTTGLLPGLEPRQPTFPASAVMLLGAAFMGAFLMAGLYHRHNLVSGWREYQLVLTASGLTLLLVIVLVYLRTKPYVSRGFLVLAMVSVVIMVLLGRFAVRRGIYAASKRGLRLDRVLIVGANRQAVAVADQLMRHPSASTQVVGFLSEYLPIGAEVVPGLSVLGEPLQLEEVAIRTDATRALVIESGLAWESLRGLVQLMHQPGPVELSLVPGLFDLHSTSMAARQLGPVLTLSPSPARIIGVDAMLKRSLDLVLGALGVVLSLPILLILVSSSVIGGHGIAVERKAFVRGSRVYVLRYFVHPQWAKPAHVSRLTDLIAVLAGRMSLVGPRPVPAERAADYRRAMSFLQSAKPGFIGPWWLVGRAKTIDVEDELFYDLYYLKNYSIWLDIEILLKSAGGIVGSRRIEPMRSLNRLALKPPGDL